MKKAHRRIRQSWSATAMPYVLSHTSGLPSKSALEEPTLDLFPLAARVRRYAITPLECRVSRSHVNDPPDRNGKNLVTRSPARQASRIRGCPWKVPRRPSWD